MNGSSLNLKIQSDPKTSEPDNDLIQLALIGPLSKDLFKNRSNRSINNQIGQVECKPNPVQIESVVTNLVVHNKI